MTEQTRDVDWAAVERRGLRRSLLGLVAFAVFFAAVILLTGGYAFWRGTAAWLAYAVFVLVLCLLQIPGRLHPRMRARNAEALRIQHALRHRLDPGPELREKTDLYARRMAGYGWMVWLFPFTPASFLLQGRWDRPWQAVPAALVIAACVAVLTVWWRRQTAAARRWNDDPPGPERRLAPPSAWERWLTGRRLMWLLVGFLAVNAAVIAVMVTVLE